MVREEILIPEATADLETRREIPGFRATLRAAESECNPDGSVGYDAAKCSGPVLARAMGAE